MDAVRLEGGAVQLWPLTEGDAKALHAAADAPGELFRYLPDRLETLPQHRDFVARALDEQAQGKALPFTVRLAESGEVVGTTRFAAIEWAHARAEIGWTWIARKVQRSAVNTQAKRLLLGHAFEVMKLNRIEFKTDSLNQVSRRAIARLGATQEGIFRNHMVMPDGRIRHTVYFSIIREEWPDLRSRLDAMLSAPDSPAQV